MSGKYPQVGAVLITTFGRSRKEWHVIEGSNIERYLVQRGGGQGRRVQGRKKFLILLMQSVLITDILTMWASSWFW